MADNDIYQRLQEAAELLDLEGWLDQYVGIKHGGGHERRLEVCPKCGNDEYKLYVNVELRLWTCYVCGWGKFQRDISVLMAEVSGRSLFAIRKELLETVRPAAAGDLTSKLEAAFAPQKKLPTVEIIEQQLPGEASFQGIIGNMVLQYAYNRGFTEEEVLIYRMRSAMKLRRFDGPFLVLPDFYQGKAVGWQGRYVVESQDKAKPKYVSSDNIASEWVWPIDAPFLPVFARTKEVHLVEGKIDAAGMWRINLPTLCTYSKSISDRQIALLKQIGIERVKLMWDADAVVTSDKKLARGAKGLRGEVEEAVKRLERNFATSVVDLSNPPVITALGKRKPDPGEILRVAEVGDFVLSRIAKAMDSRSMEYFQWRLGAQS